MRRVDARVLVIAPFTLATLAIMPAQTAQALAISPLDGTPDASPSAQISFLGTPVAQIKGVSVVGSRSGSHTGRLEAYTSAAGASFLPSKPFIQGETVTVSALVGPAARRRRVASTFTVARPASFQLFPASTGHKAGSPSAASGEVQSFHSQPGLRPPSMRVTVDSPQATPGDVFLAPAHGVGQFGPMIVDEAGRLVWFQPAPAGEVAMDLQVESYEGTPALVWWQGRIAQIGVGFGTDELYSSSYQPIARIAAGNGYQADLHEAQLTPQGAAFITAYSLVDADLSSVGGSRGGTLLDAIMQEVDVKTGLVMFEWHAWGHVALSDSYTSPGAASEPWDFFHMNSISLDPWGDGNFIISSRNTWAAYEISKHTGAILWRIGGRHPSLRMGSGTGIAWQHDARWQPDHTLTIFDDGAYPKVHGQSRAIRVRIDWSHRKVTLVSRYVHTPPLLAGSQGNYQALPDGDSFVGWGEAPYLTEFSPTGQVLFDARLPPAGQSYRAYRFPWSATPAVPPAIAVSSTGPGTLNVYASWNGATGVSAWRILGGADPTMLTPLATAPRSGFETAIPIDSADQWFAAQALAADGSVLATSLPVKP